MKYARTVLWVLMLGADAGGFAFLLAPAAMIDLVGISATPGGLTDVRAIYGGMQLGFAAFLWWSLQADDRVQGGLVVSALTLGLIAACRIVGFAVDQAPNAMLLANLALEIAAFGFAVVGLRKLGATAARGAPVAAAQKAA